MNDRTAGGSAQAEYDRRAARHAEDLRQRRPRILAFGAVMVVAALIVAVATQPLYGGVVLMLDVVVVMSALLTMPNSITAWQIGADGEARTGRLLETLETDGFRVLHDRKIPGARSANIDHIVIGPPGIYVIETKSYKGSLQIRGDEVFVAGRRKNGWIDEVNREAAAVRSVLADEVSAHGWIVTPIIVVHRTDLPWFRSEVRGVRIVSGKDLVMRLRRPHPILGPADVERLGDIMAARLGPAVATRESA